MFAVPMFPAKTECHWTLADPSIVSGEVNANLAEVIDQGYPLNLIWILK